MAQTTIKNTNIYQGIPYREKFLVYDAGGSLFAFNGGYIYGMLGSLVLSQTQGTLEITRNDGEIIIDLGEAVTGALSTGAVPYYILYVSQTETILVVSGTATIYPRSGVVGGTDQPWTAPLKIGTATSYTEFEADGTPHAVGDATVFRDMLGPLIGRALNNPGGRITQNYEEGSVDFASNTNTSDYAIMVLQINHDWYLGSDIEPHLHWWQTGSSVPNWLIQYRWQIQGSAKTTAWTSAKYSNHAFTYASGTLNQITGFPAITPPSGYGEVSDILQFRLIRDVANASTLFVGTDPVAGAVATVNFDCHYQVDMGGSRERYRK